MLIRWPLFGVLYGVITQTGTAWRKDPAMLKGFSRATLVFVGLFAIRLIVQVPLYLTGSLNALGIAKVGLGLPFYAWRSGSRTPYCEARCRPTSGTRPETT